MQIFYEFGPYRLEVRDRALRFEGRTIPIAPKVFDTLLVLVEADGGLVSKSDLLERVWKNAFVDESGIKQNISLLRRTLEPGFGDVECIVTVPRLGYRFAIPVVRVEEEPASPAGEKSPAATISKDRTGLLSKRYTIAMIAAALIVTAALGLTAFSRYRHEKLEAHRPTVLILDFQNLSGDAGVNWVSTALTEILHTDLASSEKLRLIPDETVDRMQRELDLAGKVSLSPETLRKIQDDTDCDWVITGAYLSVGDNVRLDMYLQDARNGKTVGVFSHTEPASNLLQLIAGTGNGLREKLGLTTLSPAEHESLDASVPVRPETLKLYAEGLEKLRLFDGGAARALLQQAVEMEPGYPLAHSALSSAWTLIGDEKQASKEAETAFNLSARLSHEEQLQVEAEYERATLQWEKAIQTEGTLWKAFPDNMDYGVLLAQTLTLGGKPKDALAVIVKLEAAAKNDPRPELAEASVQYQLGNYAKLQTAAHRAADQSRTRGARILLGRARTFEGDAAMHLGRPDEAQAAYAEAISIAQQFDDKVGLMHALRRDAGVRIAAGDMDDARTELQRDQQIATGVGNLREQANCLIALGLIYEEQEDWMKQRDLFQSALTLAQTIADKRLVLVSMAHIGAAQQEMGELPAAQQSLQSALTMARAMGAQAIQSYVLGELALTDTKHGELTQARSEADESLKLIPQGGDQQAQARALGTLSHVMSLQKQWESAKKTLDEECQILDQAGQKIRLARCHASSLELAALEARQ